MRSIARRCRLECPVVSSVIVTNSNSRAHNTYVLRSLASAVRTSSYTKAVSFKTPVLELWNHCNLLGWPRPALGPWQVREVGDEQAVVVGRIALDPDTFPTVAQRVFNHSVVVDHDGRHITHVLHEAQVLGLGPVLVENKTMCRVDIGVLVCARATLSSS